MNANGLTPEEQAIYVAYYTERPWYHPDQAIPTEDRHFGTVREDNPFLTGFGNEEEGCATLGQMNLIPDYNYHIPEGCTLSHAEQQKIVHSNASQMVKVLYHLTKKNLDLLKSETGHLIGCDNGIFMKSFLKKVIHESVRAVIDGTIKRLPVKDEFMIRINEEGRPALS